MEEILPPELIEYIVCILFSELTTPCLREYMGTDLLVPFHSLQYVSKNMHALCQLAFKRLSLDWPCIVSKMSPTIDWTVLLAEEEKVERRDAMVKVIRTDLYCDAQLSLLKKEVISLFHRAQYIEPTTRLSIKKLRRLKVEPKTLRRQYKAIIKTYDTTKKKQRLLHKNVSMIRLMLKRKITLREFMHTRGMLMVWFMAQHHDAAL